MQMKNPSHPGEVVRDEVLPYFGLSVAAAARALNHDRASFHKLLQGQATMTPAMALKIEKAFGTSADLLVNMQTNYDLAAARRDADRITEGVERQALAARG